MTTKYKKDNENTDGEDFQFGVGHLVEPQLKSVNKDEKNGIDGFNAIQNDDDWIKLESESDQEEDSDYENSTQAVGITKKGTKSNKSKTSLPTKVCPICAAEVKYLQLHIKTHRQKILSNTMLYVHDP